MTAAAPLARADRAAFLREVAAKLEGCKALGDGIVASRLPRDAAQIFRPAGIIALVWRQVAVTNTAL